MPTPQVGLSPNDIIHFIHRQGVIIIEMSNSHTAISMCVLIDQIDFTPVLGFRLILAADEHASQLRDVFTASHPNSSMRFDDLMHLATRWLPTAGEWRLLREPRRNQGNSTFTFIGCQALGEAFSEGRFSVRLNPLEHAYTNFGRPNEYSRYGKYFDFVYVLFSETINNFLLSLKHQATISSRLQASPIVRRHRQYFRISTDWPTASTDCVLKRMKPGSITKRVRSSSETAKKSESVRSKKKLQLSPHKSIKSDSTIQLMNLIILRLHWFYRPHMLAVLFPEVTALLLAPVAELIKSSVFVNTNKKFFHSYLTAFFELFEFVIQILSLKSFQNSEICLERNVLPLQPLHSDKDIIVIENPRSMTCVQANKAQPPNKFCFTAVLFARSGKAFRNYNHRLVISPSSLAQNDKLRIQY